jgi:hypothetical protein
MNNTKTISSIVNNVADKIRILAGAVTMAIGLMLLVLWFGWSMHTYIGSLEIRDTGTCVTNVSGSYTNSSVRFITSERH